MSDGQRFHRDDPVRTGPIRNWSNLYRQPGPGGPGDPSPNAQSTEQATRERPWSDVVSQGVKLGYHVVDEYLRQGQRVAQQINNQSYSPGAIGNDIRETVERLARYYADLGSLWGELINSLVANQDFLNSLLRPLQPSPPPPPAGGTGTNSNVAVAIEITSSRPIQVTFDLHPHSENISLVTHGLRAVDQNKPPLTDIAFVPSPDHGPLCLRIRIPDGQPPDIYTGVIVDGKTNQPRGTLSVRVEGEHTTR